MAHQYPTVTCHSASHTKGSPLSRPMLQTFSSSVRIPTLFFLICVRADSASLLCSFRPDHRPGVL